MPSAFEFLLRSRLGPQAGRHRLGGSKNEEVSGFENTAQPALSAVVFAFLQTGTVQGLQAAHGLPGLSQEMGFVLRWRFSYTRNRAVGFGEHAAPRKGGPGSLLIRLPFIRAPCYPGSPLPGLRFPCFSWIKKRAVRPAWSARYSCGLCTLFGVLSL